MIALIYCNIINLEEEEEEKVVEYKKLWVYADNVVVWKLIESALEVKFYIFWCLKLLD